MFWKFVWALFISGTDRLPHCNYTRRGTNLKKVYLYVDSFPPLECQLPLLTYLKYYMPLRFKHKVEETQSSWGKEKKNLCWDSLTSMISLKIYSSAFPEEAVLSDKAKLWALKWKPPLWDDVKHNTMLCFRHPLPIVLLHKSQWDRGAILLES